MMKSHSQSCSKSSVRYTVPDLAKTVSGREKSNIAAAKYLAINIFMYWQLMLFTLDLRCTGIHSVKNKWHAPCLEHISDRLLKPLAS